MLRQITNKRPFKKLLREGRNNAFGSLDICRDMMTGCMFRPHFSITQKINGGAAQSTGALNSVGAKLQGTSSPCTPLPIPFIFRMEKNLSKAGGNMQKLLFLSAVWREI